MDIMNRHNPVDIEERASQWRETGAGATAAAGTAGGGEYRDTGYPGGSTGSSGITARRTDTTTTAAGASAGTERAAAAQSKNLEGQQAIPVVEE